MQYCAFKAARVAACTSTETFTIQINWSENAQIVRTRLEKSAYYHNDQILFMQCIPGVAMKGSHTWLPVLVPTIKPEQYLLASNLF